MFLISKITFLMLIMQLTWKTCLNTRDFNQFLFLLCICVGWYTHLLCYVIQNPFETLTNIIKFVKLLTVPNSVFNNIDININNQKPRKTLVFLQLLSFCVDTRYFCHMCFIYKENKTILTISDIFSQNKLIPPTNLFD